MREQSQDCGGLSSGWSPAVALAVAKWLERVATARTDWDDRDPRHIIPFEVDAIDVALAYLREAGAL
jgi:hypothetical protein